MGGCYDDLLMCTLPVLVGIYSLCSFREQQYSFVSAWCAIFTHKKVVNDVMAASFDSSEQQLDLE